MTGILTCCYKFGIYKNMCCINLINLINPIEVITGSNTYIECYNQTS